MTDTPGPDRVPPLCRVCTHLHCEVDIPECDAFSDGIPDEILAGALHVDSYPGDRGIAFLKKSPGQSHFIAGSEPGTLFRVTCAGSYERYVPILDLWDLDNTFIQYVLSVPLEIRSVTTEEAEEWVESARRCLDSMNPCMREIRRMMYMCSHDEENR